VLRTEITYVVRNTAAVYTDLLCGYNVTSFDNKTDVPLQ